MTNQNELLENKELREKLKEKVGVLSKVKALLLMPNTELATTKQVADYYEVNPKAIEKLTERNKDELESDGLKILAGKELSDMKSVSGFKSRAGSLTVFSTRAILRVGMLLRDSNIAKEVRTQLLNTMEHTTDEAKVEELDKTKDLIFAVVTAKDDNSRMLALSEYHAYMDRYKDYVEKAMSSPTGITTTVIAKELGFKSATKLNKILADKKIQYKNASGQWLLYSDYADNGYTTPYTYVDEKGYTHHSTNWSESGKKFIYDLLKQENLIHN